MCRPSGRGGIVLYQLELAWLGPVWLPVPLILFVWGGLEGLAIPLPGPVILGGLAVALRPTPAQIAWLALYAAVGYTVGSSLSYWLGTRAREHQGIQRLLGRIGLGPERMAALDRWFERHGQWAVAWSRPIWAGNFISLPAGVAGMPFGRFVVLTFIGIYPTAYLFLWAGDEVADLAQRYGTTVIWGSVAALAAVVVGRMLWRRWRRSAAG